MQRLSDSGDPDPRPRGKNSVDMTSDQAWKGLWERPSSKCSARDAGSKSEFRTFSSGGEGQAGSVIKVLRKARSQLHTLSFTVENQIRHALRSPKSPLPPCPLKKKKKAASSKALQSHQDEYCKVHTVAKHTSQAVGLFCVQLCCLSTHKYQASCPGSVG